MASFFLINSSKQISRSTEKETKTIKIVEALTQIRFVTVENILNHDERSYEQWQSIQNRLQSLLMPTSSRSPTEVQILDNISKQSQEVKAHFDRLVNNYNEIPADQDASTHKAFQDRLATQLLIKQQTQITEALKLSTIAGQEAAAVKQQADRLILAVILVMFMIIALNYFFITRSITKALGIVRKGAKEIVSGNFGYRIVTNKSNNEFGRLADAFNSMAASMQQTDKVKSEFMMIASHQLRMPLTAIKWSSEALLSMKPKLGEVKQKKYLEQIHESTDRMIKLIGSLLEVSKIDFGNLSTKSVPVQLDHVLEAVLGDFSTQIGTKKLVIDTLVDKNLRKILIDPSWGNAIFQNLISNAIKYSPDGNHIIIGIAQEPNSVLIKVTDYGCGIRKDEQEKVFTKLFRGKNARKLASEGSGLGLYITKAMVDRSGGSIWFESTENGGTTFYVKLPSK